jgi:hypothetical protein
MTGFEVGQLLPTLRDLAARSTRSRPRSWLSARALLEEAPQLQPAGELEPTPFDAEGELTPLLRD